MRGAHTLHAKCFYQPPEKLGGLLTQRGAKEAQGGEGERRPQGSVGGPLCWDNVFGPGGLLDPANASPVEAMLKKELFKCSAAEVQQLNGVDCEKLLVRPP